MHPNANCNCRYADVGCDKMEEVMDQISGKWKMRILFMAAIAAAISPPPPTEQGMAVVNNIFVK